MKKYLVEFIGTFYLVLTVLCTVLLSSSNLAAAIGIGFALMVMVYAGGGISGGHYNPAVSLAAAIRGALSFKDLAQYWASQLAGAGLAALIVLKFVPYLEKPLVGELSLVNLAIAEFLFTFALCYVVLLTATTKASQGNSYYGLAIGTTVTVGIFAVGSLCLAAFNPAVALGVGIMNIAGWKLIGITALTNLIAGTTAAVIFKLVADEE